MCIAREDKLGLPDPMSPFKKATQTSKKKKLPRPTDLLVQTHETEYTKKTYATEYTKKTYAIE